MAGFTPREQPLRELRRQFSLPDLHLVSDGQAEPFPVVPENYIDFLNAHSEKNTIVINENILNKIHEDWEFLKFDVMRKKNDNTTLIIPIYRPETQCFIIYLFNHTESLETTFCSSQFSNMRFDLSPQ